MAIPVEAVDIWRPVALFSAVVLVGCSVAQAAYDQALDSGNRFAQSNEVSLGQTGATNTIIIDQAGSSNLVGGFTSDLRLNQIGDRNAITILQVGENNGVGRVNRIGQAGFLTGQSGTASGLYQSGDGNELDIVQRTVRGEGANLVGAIRQEALAGAAKPSNRAVVRQIGGGFDPLLPGPGASTGAGFHTLGEIAQRYLPIGATFDFNALSVEQTGSRQTVEQLRQVGSANTIALAQSGEENTLRMAGQIGAANDLDVRQSGTRNTIGNAMQIGRSNAAEMRVDGSGNLVDQVVQVGFGGVGAGRDNIVSLAIVGNENGGDGIGGYRAVSAQGQVGASFAASIEQYGEGNDLSLVIGSAAGGNADGNFFSTAQIGLGNAADAVLTGNGNEFALLQLGDGNRFDLVQASAAQRAVVDGRRAGNVAEVAQAGERNVSNVRQSGADNRLQLGVAGNSNLIDTAQTGMGQTVRMQVVGADNRAVAGLSVAFPGAGRLVSEGIVQEGRDHLATLGMFGDANLVSLVQMGIDHVVDGGIAGRGNAALIRQSSIGNISHFRQNGVSNFLLVQQN